MGQKLIYYPERIVIGTNCNLLLNVERKPDSLWTLPTFKDESRPPELPYYPIHLGNAFLEDIGHDWSWYGGKLKYNTLTASGEVWLLLEYRK